MCNPEVTSDQEKQIINCIYENSFGFAGDKMVDDILLILEVEVEGALGYSGAVYDVGYGSVCYALSGKQIIRLGQ